jgi:hypothetical protein
MEAVMDEIAVLAAGHQMSAGEIRYRLLLLLRQVRELVERWPAS